MSNTRFIEQVYHRSKLFRYLMIIALGIFWASCLYPFAWMYLYPETTDLTMVVGGALIGFLFFVLSGLVHLIFAGLYWLVLVGNGEL